MKTKYLYLYAIGFPFLLMCQNSANEKNKENLISLPSIKACYLAVDGKDSAFLTLNTFDQNAVTGRLLILYSDHRKNNGKFTGSYKGDTLLVNYRFQSENPPGAVFTNPLAFLKTADSLILGTGKIMKNMGRVYLDKKQGIDFEKGRFRFHIIDCKERLINLSKR